MTILPPFASLLSPPEPHLMDDFEPPTKRLRRESMDMKSSKGLEDMKQALQPMSPPVSPQVSVQNKTEIGTLSQPQPIDAPDPDPVLYDGRIHRAESSDLLFPNPSSNFVTESIREHIAKCSLYAPSKSGDPRHSRRPPLLPTEHEYRTAVGAIGAVSRTNEAYNRNPQAYWRDRMAENDDLYRRMRGTVTPKTVDVKSTPMTKPRKHDGETRIKKAISTKKISARRPASSSSSPKVTQTASPEPKTIRKKTEDVDYESLPDYCPPTTTLRPGHTFRIDWSSTKLDLSQDAHRHMLHPSEVALAEGLRLSCATYLCSKRRIFAKRLHHLQIRKEFRKTDAQQACKIDVNKASKLWNAYDGVGWFEAAYFANFSKEVVPLD